MSHIQLLKRYLLPPLPSGEIGKYMWRAYLPHTNTAAIVAASAHHLKQYRLTVAASFILLTREVVLNILLRLLASRRLSQYDAGLVASDIYFLAFLYC